MIDQHIQENCSNLLSDQPDWYWSIEWPKCFKIDISNWSTDWFFPGFVLAAGWSTKRVNESTERANPL